MCGQCSRQVESLTTELSHQRTEQWGNRGQVPLGPVSVLRVSMNEKSQTHCKRKYNEARVLLLNCTTPFRRREYERTELHVFFFSM